MKKDLQNKRLCVIAQGFTHFRIALEQLGFTVIEAAPIAELSEPVAAHADMQMHVSTSGALFVASGAKHLIQQLHELGYTVLEQHGLAPAYPKDTALNCFVLKEKLYCNPKAVSHALLEHYNASGIEVSPVKQGYTKCSTCIVNNRSIITADLSIAKAARFNGLDVLMIKNGHISLPGLNYGFIGGASGLIEDNTLAMFGNLKAHPDGAEIKSFCATRGVKIIELADSPLIDIGGIVCL